MIFYGQEEAIYTCNKNVLPILKERLKRLEDLQNLLKTINTLFASPLSVEEKKAFYQKLETDDLKELCQHYRVEVDANIRKKPFAPKVLQINLQRIKYFRSRIKAIAEKPDDQILFSNDLLKIIFIENKETLVIAFDSKTNIASKEILKNNGFKWNRHYQSWIMKSPTPDFLEEVKSPEFTSLLIQKSEPDEKISKNLVSNEFFIITFLKEKSSYFIELKFLENAQVNQDFKKILRKNGWVWNHYWQLWIMESPTPDFLEEIKSPEFINMLISKLE